MKASDVAELQKKLEKLQFELRHNVANDEESEYERRKEDDFILEKLNEQTRDIHNRKLNVGDFDIHTTLGILFQETNND